MISHIGNIHIFNYKLDIAPDCTQCGSNLSKTNVLKSHISKHKAYTFILLTTNCTWTPDCTHCGSNLSTKQVS